MPEVMSIEVDEEFDPRPPSSPFGIRKPDGSLNYGLIAGGILAIILVLALIIVVVNPFKTEKPPVVSNWTPKDPTKNIEFLESYPATSPMVRSVQKSLDSWAKYLSTGDLEDLAQTFDLAGNQYAQLVSIQSQIVPGAAAPAIVELGPVGKVSRENNIYTVRLVSTWTIPGAAEASVYKWDIDMKAKEDEFLLNTTRDSDPNEKQPINFCGAVRIVADLEDDETAAKELAAFTGAKQLELAKQLYEIRERAWTLLEDATAGSDSEDDVQAIATNYSTIVVQSRKATTLKEIGDADNSENLVSNRRSIESRAKDECDADISGR